MICLYQVKNGIDNILHPRLFYSRLQRRVVGIIAMHWCIHNAWGYGIKANAIFAYSIARLWVAEFKPPFVIIETEPFSPAIGRSASAAVMLTPHPDFCFNISFTASWVM
jgi:hypothetical protein